MSRQTSRWTTEDLERFHDEALDEPQRTALSEDLRRDPQLRDRYAGVRRVDELMRAALTTEEGAERSEPRRLMAPYAVRALAAACLLIAVSSYWLFPRGGTSSTMQQSADRLEGDPVGEPARAAYRPIRVVFSLPGRKAQHEPAGAIEPPAESDVRADSVPAGQREAPNFLARLNAAIADQRIEETLDLLADASAGQRAAGYQYIGELLRSATVAEQILDRLSPQEQVQVCAHWAGEPAVQPVAFSRLHRFSTEPSLSKDVRIVVGKLARNPALHSWLRGYRLVDQNTRVGKTTPG
jgi:hypothetical protein